MALVCYVLAAVLFLVAGFNGGVEATYQDFVAFGLALFALGHCLGGDLPVTIRRS